MLLRGRVHSVLTVVLCLSVCLGGLAAEAVGQKPAFDFTDSVWATPEGTVRRTTRIKGLVASGPEQTQTVQLRLLGERWSMLTAGQTLAEGDWSHAAPRRKTIKMSLDEAGERLLEQGITETVRQRAQLAGLQDIVVSTRLRRTKWRFKVRVDETGNFATALMTAKVAARGDIEGTLDGVPFAKPWSARIKLRGRSELVLLQTIQFVPDPGPPEPPVAAFVVGDAFGMAPFPVYFASTSSGTIDEFLWDFGDGTTSSFPHPIHVYDQAGLFQVDLTVTGPLGTDSSQHSVQVTPGSSPALPQTTFYPALLGVNQGLPRLVETLGWESYFYVGATGGFGWKFTHVVQTPSNAGKAYQILLGMDAVKPQTVRVTVYLRRVAADIKERLFGPVTLQVKGSSADVPPIESFFASTLDGVPMNALPGDRIFFEIDNISVKPNKKGKLRVHLGLCHLKVPQLD